MTDAEDIEALRRVIRTEADALSRMAEAIGSAHLDALRLLENVQGRVVVSGIGKSGHIARKIAATFASTGTPAQFVHPTEASHGDLGMIGREDLCLVISNSGETAELADLLTYARRFGMPIIAITGKPASTLGRRADVTLPLPEAPEACPIAVVPTTSTTATLALGDALAVALMHRKGFGAEDFRTFHPGGRLGAQLLTVGALMHAGEAVPLLDAATPMREGLLTMTAKGFGIAGVTEAGRLIGVITDGDLRRNLDGLLDHAAGDIATRDPKTIQSRKLASEALKVMTQAKISALFVVAENGAVEGLVHIHDCLRAGVA